MVVGHAGSRGMACGETPGSLLHSRLPARVWILNMLAEDRRTRVMIITGSNLHKDDRSIFKQQFNAHTGVARISPTRVHLFLA